MLSLLLAAPVNAAAPVTYPGTVQPSDRWWELESYYDKGEMKVGLARTEELRKSAPKDVDLIWLQVRFMFEIGEVVPRTDRSFDKLAWYQKMYDLTTEGLALSPGHGHLLFGRGIALGRLGTTRGVLASLGSVKAVEADWLAAAKSDYQYASIGGQEVLPCDAFLTLAIFYRLVPDWWIVQVMAGTRGDLPTSVEYAKRADQCSPDRLLTLKELGVSQLCLGQSTGDAVAIAQGTQTLARALATPMTGQPTDLVDLKHTKMILADPSLACEYSRDGQQDLDREKLPPDATP